MRLTVGQRPTEGGALALAAGDRGSIRGGVQTPGKLAKQQGRQLLKGSRSPLDMDVTRPFQQRPPS